MNSDKFSKKITRFLLMAVNFLSNFFLAAALVFAIRYFMGGSKNENSEAVSGKEYLIASAEAAQKPLQREVDFENTLFHEQKKTTIVTKDYTAIFSDFLGSLEELHFNNSKDPHKLVITTLNKPSADIKEADAFLVALSEKTPVNYQLVSHKREGGSTEIIYKADGAEATIIKKFTLSDDTYKINFTLTVQPKNNNSVQPRIFIPQPYVEEMGERNAVMALINTPKKALEKRKPESVVDRSWISPTLFGSENRYFIHALIHDTGHFAQRGYFTKEPNNRLAAILEGPIITQETSWTLDFYCGPKTVKGMALVDSRLEESLDFGWFSFLARGFTYLLNTGYTYIPNYGVVIILLTLGLSLGLLPFTSTSKKSMKKSVELRQKIAYIEQRYKDDPQVLAREKAEAIKKYGMPEIAGCLPLLLQLPVFIGLNKALASSFELYQAPFVGWIQDLSARDPYYVLPIITVLGIIFRTASSGGPRQRLQALLTAIIFGAIFSNFAAGLVLYIFVSTWFGVIQTFLQKAFRA